MINSFFENRRCGVIQTNKSGSMIKELSILDHHLLDYTRTELFG